MQFTGYSMSFLFFSFFFAYHTVEVQRKYCKTAGNNFNVFVIECETVAFIVLVEKIKGIQIHRRSRSWRSGCMLSAAWGFFSLLFLFLTWFPLSFLLSIFVIIMNIGSWFFFFNNMNECQDIIHLSYME